MNLSKTCICRKLITCLIFGIFVYFVVLQLTELNNRVSKSRQHHLKECYSSSIIGHSHIGEYGIKYLEDVMEIEPKPSAGKSIVFHETTCSKSGLLNLNSRQACAIESVARLNPKRSVFVLFASPVGFRDANIPTNVEILKSYPNINFRNNEIWKYAANTPLEKWLKIGPLFKSKYLSEHMSDVLRYLTLYKFGGIFLDLDFFM